MADLFFSSSNLSDEEANLNRKIAYYYMYKVTIGNFQIAVSWFSLNNSALINENTCFENFVTNHQKYQLANERNKLLDSKNLTTNQLGSLLALNEDSLYHKCNTLDADDILIYLTIRGGQQNPSWFQRFVSYFGLILSFSQGARAFIHKLLGITPPHNNNNADYPKQGKPSQDLRTTNPCEYNARGRSYKEFELSGKRRKSKYKVPSRERLTYEDYEHVQCQKEYQLTKFDHRMLPSKQDFCISLSGTDVNDKDLSGFQVRVAWGQSQRAKKNIKHGHIFGLEPRTDLQGNPITRINTKDPDEKPRVPMSLNGQQEKDKWHDKQIEFCQNYKNFEIKTNIQYMPHMDGTFDEGGFEKGLVIFDRKNNIMTVARPDNPGDENSQKFTVVTTFNPTKNEVRFYEEFGIVLPADEEGYQQLKEKVAIMDARSSLKNDTFTEQDVNAQCSNPDIEIVNMEVLTNETKTD